MLYKVCVNFNIYNNIERLQVSYRSWAINQSSFSIGTESDTEGHGETGCTLQSGFVVGNIFENQGPISGKYGKIDLPITVTCDCPSATMIPVLKDHVYCFYSRAWNIPLRHRNNPALITEYSSDIYNHRLRCRSTMSFPYEARFQSFSIRLPFL